LSRPSASKESAVSPAPVPEANPIAEPTREEFCTLLMSSAQENTLPIGFFVNLIWQESRFIRTAVSAAGALGVAQFMPAVAESLGVDNPFDPRKALPASARLLRMLHIRFGNLGLAAAAYNAGPKRIADWLAKRSPLPKETRDYVLTITGRPAEHWMAGPPPPIAFQVPRRVPCFDVASFSAAVKPADASPHREAVAAIKVPERKFAQEARATKRNSRKRHSARAGTTKHPSDVRIANRAARFRTAHRRIYGNEHISKRGQQSRIAALQQQRSVD
jgi:hypothetical protein